MKDKFIYIGFACILVYMLPYFILGENAYVTIHDFLDQNVVIMAMLKKTGLMTSLNGIVPNMDGLDRSLFPFFTPFDVKMVCYLLLPTYWAIITYTFAYKIIAFLGMYLLLNTYVFKKSHNWFSLMISIGFALVPFYVELAISGAGFPLVLYAFLNLYYNTNKVGSYIAIIFYTFNSLLAYGGFFLLVILFCCLALNYNRTKKFPKNVVIGAVVMCIVYLLANWGTFYSLFFSESFVSHRTEWVHSNPIGNDIKEFINVLLFSQYHAGSCIAFPVVVLFLLIYYKYRKNYPIIPMMAILYCIIVVGIFIGTVLKSSHIQLFITIQFDRFYFFYPSIIYLLLATICYTLINEKLNNIALPLLFLGLMCGCYYDNEIRRNVKLISGGEIEEPTYEQFYDTNLFSLIHSDLGTQPDYKTKTVSVGIYPSVAEYNGFWTLDSYRVNYPADYKSNFRKVIANEIEKNETIRKGFDEWGSRCYIFSSELYETPHKFLCGKNDNKKIKLDIDTIQLKKMGCKYVISAVDIANDMELSLSLVNCYSTERSYWKIRVYKL